MNESHVTSSTLSLAAGKENLPIQKLECPNLGVMADIREEQALLNAGYLSISHIYSQIIHKHPLLPSFLPHPPEFKRKFDELARVNDEQARVTDELARVNDEQARVNDEQARVNLEQEARLQAQDVTNRIYDESFTMLHSIHTHMDARDDLHRERVAQLADLINNMYTIHMARGNTRGG
jgi:hypothetical protein